MGVRSGMAVPAVNPSSADRRGAHATGASSRSSDLRPEWPKINLPLLFSSRAPAELASNPDPSAPLNFADYPAYPGEPV